MKPTVPQVLPFVNQLYETHRAGCCLHILLDDQNVDNKSAEFCLDYARIEGHQLCIQIAEALVQMSPTQRKKLAMLHR